MKPIVFLGTTNSGKIREFTSYLNTLGVDVQTPDDLGIVFEPEEVGDSYEVIALDKARAWSNKSGFPTLVDDSGLSVDALDGAPGIYSKRFFSGSDTDRNHFLLQKMKDVKPFDRTAFFYCALAFVDAGNGIEHLTVGKCFGTISDTISGSAGFGYDPVFIPQGYTQSFAQLGDEVKAGLSHRGKALELMKPFLQQWIHD